MKIIESLTGRLRKIKGKKDYFSGLAPINKFPRFNRNIVNAYPGWIWERKLQSQFGTFTDYVIRKMLLNHFPRKICCFQIVASGSLEILKEYKLLSPKEENYFRKVITEYQDPMIDWMDIFYDIWKMSYLDLVIRIGRIYESNETRREILETEDFFLKLEEFIIEIFEPREKLFLNPTFGHPDTLNGDADIIGDQTLYDIKTTQYPKPSDDYYQLLGYVAMHEFLKERGELEERNLSECVKLNTIGIIFPVQLEVIEMNISDWELSKRNEYLKKIISNKEED